MLKIFEPYILFISFFLTVVVNIFLISKNVNWIVLVVGNLLLILVLEFLGIGEYNFLNKIVEWLLDFIGKILKGIWDTTFGGWLDKLGRWLGFNPTTPPPSGGGGGGIGGR